MASQIYARYIPPTKKSSAKSSNTIEIPAPQIPSNLPAPTPPSTKKDASSTYARYVPPSRSHSKTIPEQSSPVPTSILKRKREEMTGTAPEPKSKRSKKEQKKAEKEREETGLKGVKDRRKEKREEKKKKKSKAGKGEQQKQWGTELKTAALWTLLPKNSNVSIDEERKLTQVEGKQKKRIESEVVKEETHQDEEKHPAVEATSKSAQVPLSTAFSDSIDVEAGIPKDKKKKRKKDREHKGPDPEDASQHDEDPKHKKVLERREESLKKAEKLAQKAAKRAAAENKQDIEGPILQESLELHDLAPLPQPDPAPEPPIQSTLSALPQLLASPIRISPTATAAFTDIGFQAEVATTLKSKGFSEAFAVQAAVLPLLLPGTHQQPGDVLVSAATGSGKTLAYVLPMIEDISHNTVTRLRGLIVMPTRDLVTQARDICNICATAFSGGHKRRVKVGTALGNKNFKVEQTTLVLEELHYDPDGYEEQERKLNAKWETSDWGSDGEEEILCEEATLPSLPGHVVEHRSKVDILICTPGRLVEHLKSNPGFTLEFVKWLVIDEADKLLDQSFQEWLGIVMAALAANQGPPSRHERVRKIILSATMTRDIGQLSDLKLFRPKFIALEGSSREENDIAKSSEALVLPSTLTEYAIKVDDENLKPVYLLELLKFRNMVSEAAQTADEDEASASSSDDEVSSISTSTSSPSYPDPRSTKSSTLNSTSHPGILIFTSSSTATLRLSRLLTILCPHLASCISSLTSSTPSSTRSSTLKSFSRQSLKSPSIIIATDLASRGLDLPSLSNVINYDIPTSIKSYVHRVGRTARAGRDGTAWTMVSGREAGWFWGAIGRGGGIKREGKVQRVDKLGKEIDERAKEEFERALGVLGREAGSGGG